MSTTTIADLTSTTGLSLTTDWSADVEIPTLAGMQRQGDVLIVPDRAATAATPVAAGGTPVVRGESGGNTHAIYAEADSGVTCDVRDVVVTDLIVATLAVPVGAQAWLGHPQHGYLGIAPGTYRIKRQREMADELRMVAD